MHGMGPVRLASRSAAAASFSSASPSRRSAAADERRRAAKPDGVVAGGNRAGDRSPDSRGRGWEPTGAEEQKGVGRGDVAFRTGGKGIGKGAGRGAIPPPIETRVVPALGDEPGTASAGRWVVLWR